LGKSGGVKWLLRAHVMVLVCWGGRIAGQQQVAPFVPSPQPLAMSSVFSPIAVGRSVGPCETCRARGIACEVLGPGQACLTCRRAHQSCSLGKRRE
jgi:hypothetical protein